jgi:TATA-box binding protein (TBP) (component of TFIID and TFIIIB)
VRQYARLLQKMGFNVNVSKICLQTMTLTYNLGAPLNLIDFTKIQDGVSYEPEIFPAVMLRSSSVNFTIFRSGKVIVSGVKNIKAVEKLFLPILLNMKLCQSD